MSNRKELEMKDIPLSQYDGIVIDFEVLYHIPDKRMKIVMLVEKEDREKKKYKYILVKRWRWGTNKWRKTPGWILEENNTINAKSSVWEKEKAAVDKFVVRAK